MPLNTKMELHDTPTSKLAEIKAISPMEFLDKLIKEGKRKLAMKFDLSYRYIDDLISFSNKRFKEFISDTYPQRTHNF